MGLLTILKKVSKKLMVFVLVVVVLVLVLVLGPTCLLFRCFLAVSATEIVRFGYSHVVCVSRMRLLA